MPDGFDGDTFLIEQLVRPVVNLYRVSANGAPVAFVRQRRMAIKEDIRFFADEQEQQELFRIKGRTVFEVAGRYDVHDADGQPIGSLEKAFRQSLVRSTWRILDAAGEEAAVAQESSLPIAIVRRVIELVPYLDLIPIPYHFTIRSGEREVGSLRREWAIRDRYTLDVSQDVERRLDRRLAIALAIGLDALQSR